MKQFGIVLMILAAFAGLISLFGIDTSPGPAAYSGSIMGGYTPAPPNFAALGLQIVALATSATIFIAGAIFAGAGAVVEAIRGDREEVLAIAPAPTDEEPLSPGAKVAGSIVLAILAITVAILFAMFMMGYGTGGGSRHEAVSDIQNQSNELNAMVNQAEIDSRAVNRRR